MGATNYQVISCMNVWCRHDSLIGMILLIFIIANHIDSLFPWNFGCIDSVGVGR